MGTRERNRLARIKGDFPVAQSAAAGGRASAALYQSFSAVA
jgi:hypothetical protein